MLKPGHIGTGLLVYAPIAGAVIAFADILLALAGGIIVVFTSMLPDQDHSLPFLTHRGVSHTIVAAAVVGTITTVGVYSIVGNVEIAGFVGAVLFISYVAHLIADMLTPTGVAFLWPIKKKKYSLSVAKFDNRVANYGLLVLGIIASYLAFQVALLV